MARRIKKSFRIDEEDNRYLQEKAKQQNMDTSKYLRLMIQADRRNHTVARFRQNISIEKQMINEINRIGVNINQIAHHVNSDFYSYHEKQNLFNMMEKIYHLLDNIVE